MIANGHHGSPNIPDFPGEFTGEAFHAHEYRDPAIFTGKDVVVVGVGNSGMDIACDAAKVAHRVYLVTRHGVHVIPKYAFGQADRPVGQPRDGLPAVPGGARLCTRPSCAWPPAVPRTAVCPSPTTAFCTHTPRFRPNSTIGWVMATSP